MKCFNCGNETTLYLCEHCRTAEILDKVFNEIIKYKPDTCENPYILEYASGFMGKYAERDCLPEVLELFSKDISAYYYCIYYKKRKDNQFEDYAFSYLKGHNLHEFKTQRVLYELLNFYSRNDFVKPQRWCEIILKHPDICCELYVAAAEYYGMIGEYDLADEAIQKVDKSIRILWSAEGAQKNVSEQLNQINKWRKNPYWPKTEKCRRAVAMFYDEKGISHPRIQSKPVKIPENEFTPINECIDDTFTDYCAFWCAEAFSIVSYKSIYQISAVKVRNGNIIDEFQSYIRPWDGSAGRKAAAKEANVALDVIECADDVDIVMHKFFDFVENDVLISTAALGNQAKLISRAARYAGMKEIKNEFFDLLDFAINTDSNFTPANTREYLLGHFGIDDGLDSLGKARVNVLLYQKLSEYGEQYGK